MRDAGRFVSLFVGMALLSGVVGGCSAPKRLTATNRYANGVVFILPGIEGKSVWNKNIAVGLDAGGVRAAIEVQDWTIGLPGGFVFNLANLERNRREAERIADHIVAYRVRHPGSPVHLIGHSAGGAVAIMALEALPAGQEVDQALLLAPAISPDYDLSLALRHTTHGAINFYSHKDIGLLKLGTTLFGSVDRKHGESAGAVGFIAPLGLGRPAQYQYTAKLRQVRWTPELRRYGANGSHIGWASRRFAQQYLAPLILKHERRPEPSAAPSTLEPPAQEAGDTQPADAPEDDNAAAERREAERESR